MSENVGITWYTLRNFFDGSLDDMRQQLMDKYGKTMDQVCKLISADEDTRILYCGMKQFMANDKLWPEGMSKRQLDKEVSEIAKRMILRNQAYSNLINDRFPYPVRLSIHKGTNAGKKYSVNLVSCSDGWSSPWHRAVVLRENGDRYELITKADAETQGYGLMKMDGRPYLFSERVKGSYLQEKQD